VQKKVIAQAWFDYLPNTFVESHAYLLAKGESKSVNIVHTLFDNGEPVDKFTSFLKRKSLRTFLSNVLFRRVIRRLFRKQEWKRFNSHCKETLRRENASLLHIHYGTTGCELLPALRASGVPSLVTFYGYDVSAALRNPRTVLKYQEMFQVVNRMVVQCEVAKQRLIALGCDDHKIKIWNFPAGVEKYPFRSRTKQAGPLRLLIGARFVPAKGHVYLFEAMKILLDEGVDLSLTMVGYGYLLPTLKKRIAELGLQDRVRIIDDAIRGGFNELFRGLLDEHDLFVLPSIVGDDGVDEGGPALTMVCAQAAGLPVISTPFPGAEISVIEGKTGFFCKEKDPRSLADAIRNLLEQPECWKEMGAAGSRLVREEFAEATQMSKLCEIYREILPQ
jgi:colanic acid/amylovoran biosynthesis glycosyltransferase